MKLEARFQQTAGFEGWGQHSKRSRSFASDATEVAFPLGGIGTGNVSIGARGELRDWELFNSPGKGNSLPYTFVAIRTESGDGRVITRVLEARRRPPYAGPQGFDPWDVAGLPRLADSWLTGEYPFVWVEFHDADLPVAVELEAFTPFIPLDAGESGLPAAILRYRVINRSASPVHVSIAFSLANAAGFAGYGPGHFMRHEGTQSNQFEDDGLQRGIFFTSDLAHDQLKAGSMALVTSDAQVSHKTQWLEGFWWDGLEEFWGDFKSDGRLGPPAPAQADSGVLAAPPGLKIGSLAIDRTVEPGAGHTFEFVLAWHFPNRPAAWDRGSIFPPVPDPKRTVRNHYALRFPEAWAVSHHVLANVRRLDSLSRDFRRALYGTTLPDKVLEAVAVGITVLRSTTCFRIEDGTFLGWEGSLPDKGSCEGSCTHVWNYAQTVAFLFPELERSMRTVEFALETDEAGAMAFRSNQVFGLPRWNMMPAADGQLGTIVRLYREWRLSGDDQFLRSLWPAAKRALDLAFTHWDGDGDGVLDREQHTTYDIELQGANPLTNSLFFAALLAGAEMADQLNEPAVAQRYRDAAARGSRRMDTLLWNGEYFIQECDDVNAFRYQIGAGCLSDQLFGQLLAHVVGLGYVLPRDHVRKAIKAVYQRNFRHAINDHHNTQRTFAFEGEPGLLMCSWPNGRRPTFPFPYSEEVWSGTEYQVAAHLIYEGFVEEGLTVVEAVRSRHDGYRRNPWNEVECGNHYARSMAGWAVFLALTGFESDLSRKSITLAPKVEIGDFATFWSNGKAWGVFRQRKDPDTDRLERSLDVLYGDAESVAETLRP